MILLETIVLKLTPSEITALIDYYQASKTTTKAQYVTFSAKYNHTTITVYTSNKVMFQGQHAQIEAKRWKSELPEKKAKKTNTTSTATLPKNLATLPLIGSDEVGNGSYFGPLVVCATFVGPEQFDTLKQWGVKDSKLLTDAQILALAPKLKTFLLHQELVVLPEKYNQIQPKYNAVRMKVALHNQAIALLENKVPEAKGALIDQFTPEQTYRKYLASEKKQANLPLYFVTKGEQYHLAVASASIICRATFLTTLAELSTQANITLPSGAGKASDDVAARIIKTKGIDALRYFAKLHFANTQKAIQQAQNKK